MPKMKTHKGAKKRFHLSAKGAVLRTKGPKSHLRRRKPKRFKRLLGGKVSLDSARASKKVRYALSGSSRR